MNEIFAGYPDPIREKMEFLKGLVIETAGETEGVDKMDIALKWGEPSFITKHGSTLRMDWKEKTPDRYACTLIVQADWSPHFACFFTIHSNLRETAPLYFS